MLRSASKTYPGLHKPADQHIKMRHSSIPAADDWYWQPLKEYGAVCMGGGKGVASRGEGGREGGGGGGGGGERGGDGNGSFSCMMNRLQNGTLQMWAISSPS